VPANHPRGTRLRQIPGMAPSLAALPAGCTFRARCARAIAACDEAPPMRPFGAPGQGLRCHHPLEAP
jgi:peptide/nickel transport system ATP-binding protein